MKTNTVKRRIRDIRKYRAQDDVAHEMEDNLYREVLRSIAEGTAEDPKEMARLALTTDDIQFARWTA